MDDHESIRQVIALYAQLLDDQRFDDVGGLFTADAVLPWGGTTFRGREDIVRGLPTTQPPQPGVIKHFVFSPVIRIDSDRAYAWSDVIVSEIPETGPAAMSFVGRYHDRLRREDGRWRMSSHITVRAGDTVPEGFRATTGQLTWRSSSLPSADSPVTLAVVEEDGGVSSTFLTPRARP